MSEAPTDSPQTPSGNAEAAKYRMRAREAETAAQHLQERVERLQRAEVLRIAGETLTDPTDLFEVGKAELSSLLTDDGELDSEKVSSAIASLAEARPQLTKGYQGAGGGLFSAQGARYGASSGGPTASFAAMFKSVGS